MAPYYRVVFPASIHALRRKVENEGNNITSPYRSVFRIRHNDAISIFWFYSTVQYPFSIGETSKRFVTSLKKNPSNHVYVISDSSSHKRMPMQLLRGDKWVRRGISKLKKNSREMFWLIISEIRTVSNLTMSRIKRLIRVNNDESRNGKLKIVVFCNGNGKSLFELITKPKWKKTIVNSETLTLSDHRFFARYCKVFHFGQATAERNDDQVARDFALNANPEWSLTSQLCERLKRVIPERVQQGCVERFKNGFVKEGLVWMTKYLRQLQSFLQKRYKNDCTMSEVVEALESQLLLPPSSTLFTYNGKCFLTWSDVAELNSCPACYRYNVANETYKRLKFKIIQAFELAFIYGETINQRVKLTVQ